MHERLHRRLFVFLIVMFVFAIAVAASVFAPAVGLAGVGENVVGGILVSARAPTDEALSRCIGSTPEQQAPYSEFEPHAAVNPRDRNHVVVAWTTIAANGRSAIRASISTNGGGTWSMPQVLKFNTCAGGPSQRFTGTGDPWVAFGPDGKVYVSANVDPFGIAATVSADGGRTWETAVITGAGDGPNSAFDNTAVTAHPVRTGTAFLLTTRAQVVVPASAATETVKGGSSPQAKRVAKPAALSETTDGGRTWTPFRAISPTEAGDYADAPQMVIDARNGRQYVFYSAGLKGDAVLLLTSVDDGKTWSAPLKVASYVSPRPMASVLKLRHSLAFAEDIIHPSIDRKTGRLYVVIADGRFTNGNVAHVSVTSSSDGGATWTEPRRVNDAAVFAATLPSIAAADNGRVGITYFESPSSPAGAAVVTFLLRERSFRLSPTGELTEVRDRLLDRIDFQPVPGAQQGVFLGDYFGLVALGDAFHAAYVKTVQRDGTAPRISADVFFGR